MNELMPVPSASALRRQSRLHLIAVATLMLLSVAVVDRRPCSAQQSVAQSNANETFYFSLEQHPYPDPLLHIYPVNEGVRLAFNNPDNDTAVQTLRELKNAPGVQSIAFDLDVKENASSSVFVGFLTPRQSYEVRWESSPLPPTEMVLGSHHEVLPLSDFLNNGQAATAADADKAYAFYIGIDGAQTTADLTITHFTVVTSHGSYQIFDPLAAPDPFTLAVEPKRENMFPPDHIPRVYLAGSMVNYGDPHWTDIILDEFNREFKGHFGVDVGIYHTPDTVPFLSEMNQHGIKTITEGHKAALYFAPYLVANHCYLIRSDGMNYWDVAPAPPPFHGEDISRPEVVASTEKMIDSLAQEGISEFLLIDYVWPWEGGPWWTSPHMDQAMRDDLNSKDTYLHLSSGGSQYKPVNFRQFMRAWTDVPITPQSMGLTSWTQYKLVAPNMQGGHTEQALKNQFLFDALYHYEYDKFLEKVGEHAEARGVTFYPSTNPENIYNGGDIYTIAQMRGVGKVAYEFFGGPLSTFAIYHSLRWYADAFRRNGKDIQLCAQDGPGGHNTSEMDPETAYAYYYDVTSTGEMVDYNNQYLEAYWSKIPTSDAYAMERFLHWYNGAEAFLLSHRENASLQPPKNVVLVASRSVLENQREFIENLELDRNGCLANLLDRDQYAYDACGKEGMAQYAAAAKVIVYCPAQSSPMHLRWLDNWIHTGTGKTLITHSFMPINVFDGTFGYPQDGVLDHMDIGAARTRLESLGVKPTELLVPIRSIERDANLSWEVDGKLLNATADLYCTSGGTVKASSVDTKPLITEYSVDGNRIVYINVRLTGDDDDFSREIVRKAMELAGQEPEVDATEGTVVHLYHVPGGRSCVVWDRATAESQSPQDRYNRVSLGIPMTIGVPVSEANSDYILYDFFSDQVENVQSDAKARVILTEPMSCGVFYIGKPSDPAFARTLADAQAVRAKMREAITARGVPIAAAQ